MSDPQLWSWRPSGEPHTHRVDLSVPVALEEIGWHQTMRPVKVEMQSEMLKRVPVDVVSIRISDSKIRTFGFTFPEVAKGLDLQRQNSKQDPDAKQNFTPSNATQARVHGLDAARFKRESKATSTRIKPPGDIIKLQDRLFYLLQPSLETMFSEGSLRFPLQPFSFQFEGIAFLYPRYAAILADEMGLGKTM